MVSLGCDMHLHPTHAWFVGVLLIVDGEEGVGLLFRSSR